MTISVFSKKFTSMTELIEVLKNVYTDDIINDFIDRCESTTDNLDDIDIYNNFVKAVANEVYNELPSFSIINNSFHVTFSNRRCYYNKNGYGVGISGFVSNDNLVFVLSIEINKKPDVLKLTKNSIYTTLIDNDFDLKVKEIGKRE